MQNKQHLGFWLLIAMLGFFVGPLLRTGDAMIEYVDREVRETRIAMGKPIGDYVVHFANAVFEQTPVTAAADTLRTVQHTRDEQALSKAVAGELGLAASQAYNSYLQGLVLQLYVATMRLAILLFWALFLTPMFAAIIIDGLMQRSVKRAEFGSIRPATFTLAGLVVIPLLSLPALYLTLPFSLSPLLAPVWAAVIALPLSVLISNSQPLFGR